MHIYSGEVLCGSIDGYVFTTHVRELLRQEFVQLRNDFDREYRRCERQYYKQEQEHIATLDSTDPKQFWEYVKKLGPGVHNKTVSI